MFASEHLVVVFLHLCFTRERQKRLQNELDYKVLGKIDEHGNIRPLVQLYTLENLGNRLGS